MVRDKQIQISMRIYEVDEEATKDAVEKYLLEAREYTVTEYIPLEQKVMPNYEPRLHGPTNTISTPVADIAIRNVDEIERRKSILRE